MRATWRALFLLATFLALTFAADAFDEIAFQAGAPDYAKVRAAQPAGLSLELTLPKASFYQGEIIRGTLTYKNSGSVTWVAILAQGDRSGRVQDVRFFGADDQGREVEAPIEWVYRSGPMIGGGRIREASLGTGTVTLIANQWLRFDHPGTYTIFAESAAVRSGGTPYKNESNAPLLLVSNKVTVTITPLDPTQETRIVAEAAHAIDDGYQLANQIGRDAAVNDDRASRMVYAAEPAIATLRYLQTPAARAALRARLDKTPEIMLAGGHWEMIAALLGAPDRPAEAALILADVRAGRLSADSGLVGLYAQLKTYPLQIAALPPGQVITPEDGRHFADAESALNRARRQAQDELLDAAKQVTAATGQTNLDLLWTAFFTNPYDATYRKPLVAHQLDLSHDRQLQLLQWLSMSACSPHALPGEPDLASEFLPLVRLYLGPPAYSRQALMIFSYARPEEAHAIVNADMVLERPHYFNNDGNVGGLAAVLHDNPKIHWTQKQLQAFDQLRFPH